MHSVPSATALALSALGLTLVGCGGGGSSGNTSGPSGNFHIESISVLAGSTWQINRQIEVRFNRDVDFSTVNLNTVQVGQVGGAPAAGEFRVGTNANGDLDPTRVVFAPRCPTLPDFSDAGLLPGGIDYRLNVVGGSSFTVHATNGQALALGQTVNFTTPDSTQASVLFVDTVTGPPAPVIRLSPTNLEASYLEIGGSTDVNDRVYFEPRPPGQFDADLGATVPAGFLAPLNLYSRVEDQMAVMVMVNQAIDPSSSNVNPGNIRLEYQEGSTWIPLAHTVTLVANCTETGALVRVTPTGILPQQRIVRVVFASGLRDVVGDGNLVDIVVGSFQVMTPTGQGVDEFREEFTNTANADLQSQVTNPAAPRAEWGGGTLGPNFNFPGTGGPPDGQFDYEVGSSIIGSQPENPIVDTTFTLISDSTGSRTEAVVDGVIDVRNFTINTGSTLTILGPNTLKIYAAGIVRINGQLIVRGSNHHGVQSINTTCIPEVGAQGNAGGGKGGTASYLTTQSTPKGEDGYGAFNFPGLGGGGGHTAYRTPGVGDDPGVAGSGRRAGGGGGGRLGADVMEVNRPTCPDQTFIGLDVETGFPGSPGANDAILGAGIKPVGGNKGPSPFGDNTSSNDFYGVKVLLSNGTAVQGELAQPWAGAGGGAGGNTCATANFPTTPFNCSSDEKGCGGGGGGGSVMILSLGDIILGAAGKIDASGGCGGVGENSGSSGATNTRIGGGSGGGSGGHVILQSASQVDLSACQVSAGGGIFARGGQGGAGRLAVGGAVPPGVPTGPGSDALPWNSYPSTAASTECEVTTTTGYTFNNTIGDGANNDNSGMGPNNNVVTNCGGDGGPGLIQIHVQRLNNNPSLSDLKIPPNASTNPMKNVVSPTPVGATPANVQQPGNWDQMLPQFGRLSTGLSKWIPLGAAGVSPGTPNLHAVEFIFRGSDPSTGLISSSGGNVTQLPAILSGTLAGQPTLPYVTGDSRSIVFDPTGLDPIYTSNPNLMLRFGLSVTHIGVTSEFEVVAADNGDDPAAPLRLTVATSGAPLGTFGAGDSVTVVPRFFRVSTNGVNDALPGSAAIKVSFQAAPADLAGNPTLTGATQFLTDASLIDNDPNATNFKFVRFRVDFDILADGSSLTFSTPRPRIDFLRLPFKF